MTVFFYKREAEYGYLSNFSHHGFTLDGLYWPTSEHYFQAQKFLDEAARENVRLANNPSQAARAGRNRELPIRDDWDSVRCKVMERAVYAKFSQNDDILRELLSAGDEELVEDTRDDYFWGCGQDRTGENNLGKILMQVRESLRLLEFREGG